MNLVPSEVETVVYILTIDSMSLIPSNQQKWHAPRRPHS